MSVLPIRVHPSYVNISAQLMRHVRNISNIEKVVLNAELCQMAAKTSDPNANPNKDVLTKADQIKTASRRAHLVVAYHSSKEKV